MDKNGVLVNVYPIGLFQGEYVDVLLLTENFFTIPIRLLV